MMYRVVMICCLIAVGYAGTIMPLRYKTREIRQTLSASENPNHVKNNNNSYDESIPTYPVYTSNHNDAESSVLTTENPEKNSESTVPTTISSTVENSKSPSFLSNLSPYIHSIIFYGNITSTYLLRILGALFLSTTFLGLICSYMPICSSLEVNEVKNFARAYTSPQQLNNLTEKLYRAMETYSKM